MDFRSESVVGLAEQVRGGRRSATSLVDHALAQIAAHNPTINAFVAVDEERARAGAAAVDAQLAAGRDPGPLAGIPLGVKDLEDAAGYVTTHGSAAYADDPPAPVDSALVARLVAAALPPDEPPAVWSRFHGFRVAPNSGFSVSAFQPSSGVLVLPTTTHPAATSRATKAESWVAGGFEA